MPDDVIDAAKQRMIDIAKRHAQETTKRQNFDRLVENEKRKNRGGDDFVTLGKRKQPEKNIPLSILRKKIKY